MLTAFLLVANGCPLAQNSHTSFFGKVVFANQMINNEGANPKKLKDRFKTDGQIFGRIYM